MKNILIYIAAILCFVAVAAAVLILTLTGNQTSAEFTPPTFETAAVSGTPEVDDNSWSRVYREGMEFFTHICGKVSISGQSADLYFTNDNGNDVWMKLRITDEKGNVLAKTGLLKPNEYLKTAVFDTVPTVGTKIKLKIMAYEPNTYYSAGAVTLNTTVGN